MKKYLSLLGTALFAYLFTILVQPDSYSNGWKIAYFIHDCGDFYGQVMQFDATYQPTKYFYTDDPKYAIDSPYPYQVLKFKSGVNL